MSHNSETCPICKDEQTDFVTELSWAKKEMPSMRFGQIISIAMADVRRFDTFYIEDHRLAEIIHNFRMKMREAKKKE